MIDSALPIAQQDAATYSQAALQNQDALNRAALQDASLGTNVDIFNVGEANTTARFNAEAANRAGLQDAQIASQVSMFNVGEDTQTARFNADAANRAALQDALTNARVHHRPQVVVVQIDRRAAPPYGWPTLTPPQCLLPPSEPAPPAR